MELEVYGVLFEDSGSEYLIAVFEDEEEARGYADEQDRAEFARTLEDCGDDPEAREPAREDCEAMYYVEPISRELADEAREELERGMAVRVE
jgi:hypothetical protein